MDSIPDPKVSLFRRSSVALTILVLGLFALVCKRIYAYLTHPLRHVPGPSVAGWTNIIHSYYFLSGRQPYSLLSLHEKYGPVVRIAPNEISFSSANSWKDIYGFRTGHRPFIKSPFYDGGSFADQAHSIVSERDPAEHGVMRKYLSHAFSDKSLKEQEYLIAERVDLFIEQVGQFGAKEGGIDFVKWFNLLTFDIIGSLAFGEPFGGLETAKFHPWINLVSKALRQGALADTFQRFPVFARIFKFLMPSAINALIKDTRTHESYTMALVEKRLQKSNNRPDFLNRMIENREMYNISEVQIAAHSSDFVTAGSETTATTLACVVYYLTKDPSVFSKLQNEIRGAFRRFDDINAKSTQSLKYLNAVCLEGMRIYAPLPFPLPRVVPVGGDTVDGWYLPAGTIVSTNPTAASLSHANFSSPWEFKPERWLGQAGKDTLDASQPFSLGARGCLGRNLAWIELNTVLAKLLWKHDLELVNQDVDWQRDSRMHTLWKKPELMVRVRTRKDE
ncbi:cytochrome P450 [Amniculicola lignicola CBS 123094]|uniref:Cytochrome P450 n=1 Tax=Amniculicola lignicola CBS 123094 TaxID=1392246 RepID=A0A6A5VX26_9PLEO|nr:cytochrome P450 [Amniculicola lignicola CBS 123094]